ncbi:ankyrin repeat domain-containing protein [Sansalvadorimonas verongulae]|uniref:ankyrin repeat domain-containing protein n=1 Tax=Sansalvadorimonas verongulae TaxID=2172824 RepID=UPI0018AD2609|nr:ankyrin repeat domain-containing protein [Sansalvadorimonas verongulae]
MGEHPFIAACREGDIEQVRKYTSQEHFDLNARLNAGRFRFKTTGLHAAAENDHPEVLRILIVAGSRIENVVRGFTALCRAAAKNHLESAKVLIEFGARVNTEYCVPLYHASFGGHHEMVRLLLSHGADPQLKHPFIFWKESPIFAAKEQRFFKPYKLRAYNKTIHVLRHAAPLKDDTEVTPLLLEKSTPLPQK